jgi:hypothetical protein
MSCTQTDEFSVTEVSFWQMKSGWGKVEYIHCGTMNERTGIAWQETGNFTLGRVGRVICPLSRGEESDINLLLNCTEMQR